MRADNRVQASTSTIGSRRRAAAIASASRVRAFSREEFLGEFFPDPSDKAAIAAGME